MGVIGYGWYDSDVACDVKNEFTKMIYNGISCKEATANINRDFDECLQDSEDRPVVRITLADIQWEMGILLKKVKTNALDEIDNLFKDENSELKQIFEDDLKEIKNKLNMPMPPKVKIKKQVNKIHPSFCETGDVFRVHLTTDNLQSDSVKYLENRWIMMQVTGIVPEKVRSEQFYYPIMRAYISKDNNMPEISVVSELEPIVIGGGPGDQYEYRFYVDNITEDNIKKYFYCGNSVLLSPDNESVTDLRNIMYFDIEDLPDNLAWCYYYLKKDLNY